jgi:hypothetical protein
MGSFLDRYVCNSPPGYFREHSIKRPYVSRVLFPLPHMKTAPKCNYRKMGEFMLDQVQFMHKG